MHPDEFELTDVSDKTRTGQNKSESVNVHVYMCRHLSTVPVSAALDSDNMLGGVAELLAIVSPGHAAGRRVGIKLYPETKAFPLFHFSLAWARASQHGNEASI